MSGGRRREGQGAGRLCQAGSMLRYSTRRELRLNGDDFSASILWGVVTCQGCRNTVDYYSEYFAWEVEDEVDREAEVLEVEDEVATESETVRILRISECKRVFLFSFSSFRKPGFLK